MIDRKIESDIKSVKEFLELWGKLHAMHETTFAREIITEEDEKRYSEEKELVRSRYAALMKGLDFQYAPHGRVTDPICDVLGVATVRFMSEKNMKKLDGDWAASYVFLNNILERLESRRRRLRKFNPFAVYVKRLFERN